MWRWKLTGVFMNNGPDSYLIPRSRHTDAGGRPQWQLGGKGGPRATREAPPKVCGEKRTASETMWLKIRPAGVSCDHTEQNNENVIQSAESAASRETPSPPASTWLQPSRQEASASFTFNTTFQWNQPGGHWGRGESTLKTFVSGGTMLCWWVSFFGFKQQNITKFIFWGILK